MKTTNRMLSPVVCTLVALVGVGCEDKSAPKPGDWPAVPSNTAPTPAPSAAGAPSAPKPGPEGSIDIAGLLWTIPDGWQSVGASGMRLAEYSVGPESGAASVRFFSTQGSAEANVERWKGQVKDPTDGPTTKTISAGPLTSHTVAMTGTYSGMGPGGAPTAPAAGTRMLAAYIEGGPRPVQVIVVGPDEVVRSIEQAWEQMLAGAQVAR